jgi:hypothetical protein
MYLGTALALAASGCSSTSDDGTHGDTTPPEGAGDVPASQGEALVSAKTTDGTEVSFIEYAPGVVVTGLIGTGASKRSLPEGGLVEQYRALFGADAVAEHIATLSDAEARVQLRSAREPIVGELTAAPGINGEHDKYFNPNGCNPASTQWTTWFRNNKCTNGGDFGSGWWIDNWPAVCNTLRRGYTGVREGWFTVNFDAVGPSSCSSAYLRGYGHLQNTFPVIVDVTITRGHWYAYRSTLATQSWRLDGDGNGQCRQTQLHACFLAK